MNSETNIRPGFYLATHRSGTKVGVVVRHFDERRFDGELVEPMLRNGWIFTRLVPENEKASASVPEGCQLPAVADAFVQGWNARCKEVPEGCKLVVIADGSGDEAELHLQVEKDGEAVAMLAWPKSWPERVNRKQVEKAGFEWIVA